MILACSSCTLEFVMDGWSCRDCSPGPTVVVREERDLNRTPVLAAVLARVDLRLAIAEALPLLKMGRVSAAIDVLEGTIA